MITAITATMMTHLSTTYGERFIVESPSRMRSGGGCSAGGDREMRSRSRPAGVAQVTSGTSALGDVRDDLLRGGVEACLRAGLLGDDVSTGLAERAPHRVHG